MADSAEGSFELSHSADVTRCLRELAEKAIQRGVNPSYVAALKVICAKLQAEPLQWGDPEYHPQKKGTCVLHAICSPLFVRYVVFESERKVMLLKVQPLPLSSLE